MTIRSFKRHQYAAVQMATHSWPILKLPGYLRRELRHESSTMEVFMKFLTTITIGSVSALATGVASAQSGTMMNVDGM